MRRNILKDSADFRIVRHPRRRKIALRIAPDGAVELLAPPDVPEKFLRQIFQQQRNKIDSLLAGSRENLPRLPEFTEGEIFFLLGKSHALHLSKRLRLFDGERFIIPEGTAEEKKADLIRLYREIASVQLLRRAEKMEEFTRLRAASWRISSTDRRWGSCNARGDIALSWKLIQCPPELIDYVIIHELAHLQELNHSAAFWQIVAGYVPDFRRKRSELNRFARRLPQL